MNTRITDRHDVRPAGGTVHAVSDAVLNSARCMSSASWLALLIPLTGCAVQTSTFEIVDYRADGEAKSYHQTFDEAYYAVDDGGTVSIVLQRSTPSQSNPGSDVRQVIHLRSVWRCVPGETVSHRTQINGTVSYHLITGQIGATFEGAGSLFFSEDRKKHILTGSLDLATLKPTRRLAASHDLFRKAELKGQFHAVRDPRRVRRIVNDMNRLFARRL